MKTIRVVFILLFCLVISANGFVSLDIVKSAGDNNNEVSKLIATANKIGYTRWVEFLLSSMPNADLVNLKADDFISYLEALDKNLKRVPWRDRINDNLFYYYILPHRVSQEPLENFTSLYADTLFSLIKNTKNMREAALRINSWAFTQMEYKPTSRWDQGAVTTINRGFGRCEEMAILTIKALRTVCIPARMVYTPWWPFTNSNHAWVEVWADGRWYALGGAELADLDNAWFSVPSKRAAIIKSIVYGRMKDGAEPIYKRDKDFTVINSTPNYTEITELFVGVRKNNQPVESTSVSINVYNYSSLRPVGLKKTDKDGFVKFIVGKTDLFVYGFKDSLWGYKVWRSSEKLQDTVIVNISKREFPDTSFWLYTRRIKKMKSKNSTYKPNRDSLKLLQHQHFCTINIVDSTLIETLTEKDKKLVRIFYNAKAKGKSFIKFYRKLSNNEKEIFIDYFNSLPPKDIVSSDTTGLLKELKAVDISRKLIKEGIPDSVVKENLLSDRILFEHFAYWRYFIQQRYLSLKKRNIRETVDTVFLEVKNNIGENKEKGYFGPEKNPEDVCRTKTGTKVERYILIVGILRSIGIPAKIKWDYNGFLYWNSGWKEKSFDKKTEKGKEVYLSLKFDSDGRDITKKQRYYYDYGITRFGEYPDMLDVPIDTTDGRRIISLDDKPAYCITGWRNGYGDTYLRIKKVKASLDTTDVLIETGIPEKIRPGDLLVREYKGFDAKDYRIKDDELKTGNVLIIVFDTETEASKSTLTKARKTINNFPGKVFFFASAENKRDAETFLKKIGISYSKVFIVSKEIYRTKWRIRNLPSIIYLKDGKCIFWVEGLFLHLSRLIEDFS